VSFGAGSAPIGPLPHLSHACRDRPNSRRALAGFTKSSTTAFGHDLASHFPQIVDAVRSLPVQSCVIDGEAIVTDDKGLAVFDLFREHRHHVGAELCAFDMIELDGEDLRRSKLEERKRTLAKLLGRFQPGIVVNEYFEGDGAVIFEHACALGCEGIVSKRLGSSYRPGRSDRWLKIKNPDAPAARRLEEEDWY